PLHQPGVLLLQEFFELPGELGVVELAGAVLIELTLQAAGEARQHNAHQLFAHESPIPVIRPGTAADNLIVCRLSREGKDRLKMLAPIMRCSQPKNRKNRREVRKEK